MLALAALVIWLYLFFAHGRFWLSGPELPKSSPQQTQIISGAWPAVDIIIPARDEAETIATVIASLVAQDYPGVFRLTLVDDNSSDRTAAAAASACSASHLRIIEGEPRPEGWSGKLWALSQGVAATSAPVILFTDADIVHEPAHLSVLVAHLQAAQLEMASEMVRLNCSTFAERALVPAFVYFFQMLYPFARVNDPRSRVAAAAGGTVLIRREALERIGGIEAIRSALIDDVTLAQAVKTIGPIYLGHTRLASSIRPYPGFTAIWQMIARTAFTQLRHSSVLLLLTLAALALLWLVPLWSSVSAHGGPRIAGLAVSGLAALSYIPTLMRYRRSPLWVLALPFIALFYMAATLGSACNHWFGGGASWKNRSYGQQRE
ncbi:MAG TPA: glycosyltransferase [Steroidobacteraceae bacterium]|nr:glycosyltransferase [Steroidobacteraceae bacterium]